MGQPIDDPNVPIANRLGFGYGLTGSKDVKMEQFELDSGLDDFRLARKSDHTRVHIHTDIDEIR